MAHGTLGLPASLLPWRQGGVDYVLAEAALPPELSLCHAQHAAARPSGRPPVRPQGNPPRQEAPAQNGHARQPEQAGRASQTGAGTAGPTPGSMASRYPRHGGRPVPPQTDNTGQAAPAGQQPPAQQAGYAAAGGSGAPTAARPPAPPAPPPDHWPRLWQQRLAATRPAPVLWTYWALGEDLCGTPNAARRALLQRLLADLGHPAGTHCFWPAALPGTRSMHSAQEREDGLEANSEVFWAGVGMLKARALVVMGQPAVKALDLPARLRPFQQTRHNGRLVVVLRDMDFLVQETHHYDAVREFLRQALAQFAR